MPKKIKVKNYQHKLNFSMWEDDSALTLYYHAVGIGIISCEMQESILDQIELFLISAGEIKTCKPLILNLHGSINIFEDIDDDEDDGYITNKEMIKKFCPDFQYQRGFPLLIQITINPTIEFLNDFYVSIHDFNTKLKKKKLFHNSTKIYFTSNQQIAVKFKNIQPILD